MNRIFNKLKELKPILKERYGIEEFAIFGSVARGEEKEKSDIDIAVTKMDLKSGFALIEAKYFLEDVLKRRVDIGSFKSMKKFIRDKIYKELIYL